MIKAALIQESESDAPERSPAGADPRRAMAEANVRVHEALNRVADRAAAEGMPRIDLRGQLIRPLIAYAAAQPLDPAAAERFWHGVLALQLAHEASLVHDDIVDEASSRRGAPTLVAARGVGVALVHGDHLLTAAYRLAALTGSMAFVEAFARSVERTVAGEIAQGRTIGQPVDFAGYREIAVGKAGELLGCALAASALVDGHPDAPALRELGRRMGLLYQMLDDLLDYCPAMDTGKPALGDYRQGRWTWPLFELPGAELGRDVAGVVAAFAAPAPQGSVLRRCLLRLQHEADELRSALQEVLGPRPVLDVLLQDWLERAREAVELQEARSRVAAAPTFASPALRARLPAMDEVGGYFGLHSRSFQFASRLFPREDRERVARIYAFCRVTDDLVDHPDAADGTTAETMLAEWEALAERAYRGQSSGIAFLDRVMGEAASADVPFAYMAELIEGMRMDLRGQSYASLAELRVYTYRVASVVGLWLSRLFGVHDPWALERAAALGHAMQLTNILRDVGEDARRGRVYLPLDRLRDHGLDPAELVRISQRPSPLPPRYAALVEDLLRVAEADYREAFAAIPCLPPAAQRPVAVAAHVYRGIHDEIRRRGYDNLHGRASTSTATKLRLATRALRELHHLKHTTQGRGQASKP